MTDTAIDALIAEATACASDPRCKTVSLLRDLSHALRGEKARADAATAQLDERDGRMLDVDGKRWICAAPIWGRGNTSEEAKADLRETLKEVYAVDLGDAVTAWAMMNTPQGDPEFKAMVAEYITEAHNRAVAILAAERDREKARADALGAALRYLTVGIENFSGNDRNGAHAHWTGLARAPALTDDEIERAISGAVFEKAFAESRAPAAPGQGATPLRDVLIDARRVVASYCVCHPKWTNEIAEQDPDGAHSLLRRIDAELAAASNGVQP